MNPGSSVPPRRSTGSASASLPAGSEPSGPTAVMVPLLTLTTVPAGMNLTPSKTVPL